MLFFQQVLTNKVNPFAKNINFFFATMTLNIKNSISCYFRLFRRYQVNVFGTFEPVQF